MYGVGWVERSETQLGVRKMLGFVPQPNLQLMLILGLKTVPNPKHLTPIFKSVSHEKISQPSMKIPRVRLPHLSCQPSTINHQLTTNN